jgi:hypothetical protein
MEKYTIEKDIARHLKKEVRAPAVVSADQLSDRQ